MGARSKRWIDDLEREHGLIARVVAAVDRTVSADRVSPAFAQSAIQFFQVFVDRYHERKEEEGLFPVLCAHDGIIDEALLSLLRAEHAAGREYFATLSASAKDPEADRGRILSPFCERWRGHLAREAALVAPVVAANLAPDEHARVDGTFAAIEAAAGPSGGPRAMRGLAEALETASLTPHRIAGGLRARDLMRTRTGAVDPAASLQRAADQMTVLGVRELPVVRNGAVVGIVAQRDLEPHRGQLEWTPVHVAMTADPTTIGPETPVSEVARLLTEHGVNAVPVVADGLLLGMIGRRELLAVIADPIPGTST